MMQTHEHPPFPTRALLTGAAVVVLGLIALTAALVLTGCLGL